MRTMFKKYLAWWVLLLWLIASAAAYWFYQQRYMQPIEVAFAQFEADERLQNLFKDESQDKQAIRVVYFWQAGCACDEWVKAHFLQITQSYRNKPVEFVMANLSPSQPLTAIFRDYPTLSDAQVAELKSSIPMTPAVAIWDQQGDLSYFGPHSLGAFCNDDTSLIKPAVESLLAGISAQNIATIGSGCFCQLKH